MSESAGRGRGRNISFRGRGYGRGSSRGGGRYSNTPKKNQQKKNTNFILMAVVEMINENRNVSEESSIMQRSYADVAKG